MKQRSKLSQQQTQNVEHDARQETRQQSGQEFATADELLRFDAAQTTVPPEIARRLEKSVGDLQEPKTNWWQRLLGGTD